jgi:hypothetical protein
MTYKYVWILWKFPKSFLDILLRQRKLAGMHYVFRAMSGIRHPYISLPLYNS